MARPVHSSLIYNPSSVFISRNCSQRRIFKRRSFSTAAQAADDTTPPPPPGLSTSLLELNRSFIRKSIGAEQLAPVKNAILKPFSNPFAGNPLNYDSLWYDPPSFDALVDSHLRVLESYENGTSFLRVSGKRYLYFMKAVLSERTLPRDWKCHAMDRVATYLSCQHRAQLVRPRRRRFPVELLGRNERLLILLNAICAEAERAGNLPLPQSLVELSLEMAVECRNFPACMAHLQRLCESNHKMSSRVFKKVVVRLGEPPRSFSKILALRPFRAWDSTLSAMVMVGVPEETGESYGYARLSTLVERNDPTCFKPWLESLAAMSAQSPESRLRLTRQLRREWDNWRNSLRPNYEKRQAPGIRPDRRAAELEMCFLESFVRAGAYSDGWRVLFSTKIAFTALPPDVRRALIENPEFTQPKSWTPENEKQVLSVYAEYLRAIEGALGVQWVRDEATGESYHRISTGNLRAGKSRASRGRVRRRISHRPKK
ncbi:uncharacterized protein J3D65DRAFT_667584 [Phyllosticta citribraziliensis]|uniref:Uncharacterized protein n=1 Tax=Phyllosticta citribraziliensis TaxID=989973 RepID=A0ABR1LQU7_9PEZI